MEELDDLALVDSLSPRPPESETSLHRSLATYRYENALVKTELAATLERHTREMEELRLKYQAQVREVDRQRMELESQLSELQEGQGEQLKKAQQTNLQLLQKIKMLEEDLEAGNRAREKVSGEKQRAEEELHHTKLSNQTALETLKSERNQLSSTLDHLRGDLEKERTTSRELATTLSSERHQYQLIKSRLREVEQQCRVQLAAEEAELAQLRQTKESELAAASNRVQELEREVEVAQRSALAAKQSAESRYLEVERNAAEERQAHLTASHKLTLQNSQLQEQIKKLEQTVRNLEEGQNKVKSEVEVEVERVREKLHESERERALLEGRLAGLGGLEESLRRERQSVSTLRQDFHILQSQLDQVTGVNKDLYHNIDQLKDKLSETQKQYEAAMEAGTKERDAGALEVGHLRASHQEEVEQLRARLAALQMQLTDKSTKYLDECSQLKQKLRTYGQLIKKLRHRLEVNGAEMERISAQREALEADRVPSATHARLRARLQDLTRRHNEFASFITGLTRLQDAGPEVLQLTSGVSILGQKLSKLEEDQQHCLSDLESL